MRSLLLCLCGILPLSGVQASPAETAHVKAEILRLASSFSGKGDPDFQLQRQLDPLVERLVALSQPAAVGKRAVLLEGTWKQVWGPYNYRSLDRSVDPALDTASIYQFVEGNRRYANVCIVFDSADRARPRVSLLRGELQPGDRADSLAYSFTGYYSLPGVDPASLRLADLPRRFAAGELTAARPVMPGWLVRLLSTDGVLREVYTDETLRLLYAHPHGKPEKAHLYVMTRVAGSQNSPALRASGG
ncbi:hypothetical protein [Nibricoccus sp. IMCC34717]|uniref:hypothetical protein n=1 Tax=Nibricoccus sp. IMCC34717 TaxID=3034021 RepID=UPI00384AD99C